MGAQKLQICCLTLYGSKKVPNSEIEVEDHDKQQELTTLRHVYLIYNEGQLMQSITTIVSTLPNVEDYEQSLIRLF